MAPESNFSNIRHLPQSILDHYNAAFNNTTYCAFSQALAMCLEQGADDPKHIEIMNLLIDTAFERTGAEMYRGSGIKLGTALVMYHDPDLLTLAERHLRNFNPTIEETVLIVGLLVWLEALLTSAKIAVRAVSEQHDWRGRVAFYWLSSVSYLVQAAQAVLKQDHASYVQEKLMAAVRQVSDGLDEGQDHGLSFPHRFMMWMTRFPRF
jgi:hypothetical protein